MEKRRHVRLLVEDNAFAALGARFTKVGRVKNVSTGGLAFEYITDVHSDEKASQLDVFVSGQDFHLPKVLCKVVYDIPVERSDLNRIFFQPFVTKQCGVQFEPLPEDKVAQLTIFLKTHTKGVAP
ncbi:MAG: PilZ domain-containing protein [Thermodesulfobacteriota bacterium]|nr:PilZ domain-containing protein [Thermodesulfobacteriota bacterium]